MTDRQTDRQTDDNDKCLSRASERLIMILQDSIVFEEAARWLLHYLKVSECFSQEMGNEHRRENLGWLKDSFTLRINCTRENPLMSLNVKACSGIMPDRQFGEMLQQKPRKISRNKCHLMSKRCVHCHQLAK